MTIIKVTGNDDACLDMVNASEYGLGSRCVYSLASRLTEGHLLAVCVRVLVNSVFCKDLKRCEYIASRIRAGMTVMNDFAANYLVQSLPFGGVKISGYDRFAGPEGLRALCLQKSVVVDKYVRFQMLLLLLLLLHVVRVSVCAGLASSRPTCRPWWATHCARKLCSSPKASAASCTATACLRKFVAC